MADYVENFVKPASDAAVVDRPHSAESLRLNVNGKRPFAPLAERSGDCRWWAGLSITVYAANGTSAAGRESDNSASRRTPDNAKYA